MRNPRCLLCYTLGPNEKHLILQIVKTAVWGAQLCVITHIGPKVSQQEAEAWEKLR